MPVFLFVVLLVYSTIAPLILVFGTFYYCLAYLVLKYQLLYGKCAVGGRGSSSIAGYLETDPLFL